MSEWTTGQPRSSESQYANRQPPDPAVAAVDAFRAAIVAQTALLRSLSEQVRLGFEDLNILELSARLAGLAERLEKLERDNLVIASRLLSIEGKLPASEIRTTLARKQILLKDLQPKRAAARRKAKR